MEENRSMILAGEIGATNTRLAAFETTGSRLNRVVEKIYPTPEQSSGLATILGDFVRTEGIPVDRACFGVAGPVSRGKATISNLPALTIDCRQLATQLRVNTVGVLNDLEAYAYGVDALDPDDIITLSPGLEDAEGNCVVISARTGLGVAGLYWDGYRHHPFATEGGHVGFAPRNEIEMDLLRYLQQKYGRVSTERIVSGPGIKNIYDFLRDTKKAEEPPALADQLRAAKDAPALISKLAAEGKTPICTQTFSLFVTIYGAFCGDCAVSFMTRGGVYIGGSIAAKNVPRMQDPAFLEAFFNRGRMEPLLRDMPVKIVLNDDAGLLGAARYTLVQKAFQPPKTA
jgi:glucokinase